MGIIYSTICAHSIRRLTLLFLDFYTMKKNSNLPKQIPYAVGNFEEIIYDNYYYVDKTSFIKELEKYKAPVFLRPRRFGKSLWCSTLECYYDINRKSRFEELFLHLSI